METSEIRLWLRPTSSLQRFNEQSLISRHLSKLSYMRLEDPPAPGSEFQSKPRAMPHRPESTRAQGRIVHDSVRPVNASAVACVRTPSLHVRSLMFAKLHLFDTQAAMTCNACIEWPSWRSSSGLPPRSLIRKRPSWHRGGFGIVLVRPGAIKSTTPPPGPKQHSITLAMGQSPNSFPECGSSPFRGSAGPRGRGSAGRMSHPHKPYISRIISNTLHKHNLWV